MLFTTGTPFIDALGASGSSPQEGFSPPQDAALALLAAEAALDGRAALLGGRSAVTHAGLVQEHRNLATARAILAALQGPEGSELDRALAVAHAGARWEVSTVGADWSAPHDLTGHLRIPEAVEALAERHGITFQAKDFRELGSLDGLPEPFSAALAELLNAFLVFDEVTRSSLAGVHWAAIQALDASLASPGAGANAALLVQSDRLSTLFQFQEHGLGVAPVLLARDSFLAAVQDFVGALRVTPSETLHGVAPLTLCPVLALDLAGVDSQYDLDCAFILDLGGNDRYSNNAGGSAIGTGCPNTSGVPTGAAALIDLGGDDLYGTPGLPRGCGANGGGFLGTGLLIDVGGSDQYVAAGQGVNGGGWVGAGLLVDVDGDDTYTGGGGGVNGGGHLGLGMLIDTAGSDIFAAGGDAVNGGGRAGVGQLIDLEGDDAYSASVFGVNGAGQFGGRGFLLDASGNDSHKAVGLGANGGGHVAGIGALLDFAGRDEYLSDSGGTNGGGAGGSGLLLDVAGNDTYRAGDFGVNGGAYPNSFLGVPLLPFGLAVLMDAGGFDLYEDTDGGSGQDKSVVPKGVLGAQIDITSTT